MKKTKKTATRAKKPAPTESDETKAVLSSALEEYLDQEREEEAILSTALGDPRPAGAIMRAALLWGITEADARGLAWNAMSRAIDRLDPCVRSLITSARLALGSERQVVDAYYEAERTFVVAELQAKAASKRRARK